MGYFTPFIAHLVRKAIDFWGLFLLTSLVGEFFSPNLTKCGGWIYLIVWTTGNRPKKSRKIHERKMLGVFSWMMIHQTFTCFGKWLVGWKSPFPPIHPFNKKMAWEKTIGIHTTFFVARQLDGYLGCSRGGPLKLMVPNFHEERVWLFGTVPGNLGLVGFQAEMYQSWDIWDIPTPLTMVFLGGGPPKMYCTFLFCPKIDKQMYGTKGGIPPLRGGDIMSPSKSFVEGLECANRLLVFAVRVAQQKPRENWCYLNVFCTTVRNRFEGYFNPSKWKMEPTEDMNKNQYDFESEIFFLQLLPPAMKWWPLFFQHISYHRVHTVFVFPIDFFLRRKFSGLLKPGIVGLFLQRKIHGMEWYMYPHEWLMFMVKKSLYQNGTIHFTVKNVLWQAFKCFGKCVLVDVW